MAQWITRLPTEQKIPGSNPGALEYFYILRLSIIIIIVRIGYDYMLTITILGFVIVMMIL